MSDSYSDSGDDNYADAGASDSTPLQCSALRKGGYVLIKNRPCKIVQLATSKTGKHGRAKVHLVGIDIFTNKKHDHVCPSTHNMQVPVVVRKEYELMEVNDDDFTSLFDNETNEKIDGIKLPGDELGEKIKEKFENNEPVLVVVIRAMREEQIISYRIKGD